MKFVEIRKQKIADEIVGMPNPARDKYEGMYRGGVCSVCAWP